MQHPYTKIIRQGGGDAGNFNNQTFLDHRFIQKTKTCSQDLSTLVYCVHSQQMKSERQHQKVKFLMLIFNYNIAIHYHVTEMNPRILHPFITGY